MTAIDHATVTAGWYFSQLNKGVAAFQAARCLLVDTQSPQVELLSITARLNPANGGAQNVTYWLCQPCAAMESPAGFPGIPGTLALVPPCHPLPLAAASTPAHALSPLSGINPT